MRSSKSEPSRRRVLPPPPPPAAGGGASRSSSGFARRADLLALLACTVALVFAAPARAQTLDLGPTTAAPKPGEGLAALSLADTLDGEAKRFDRADARRAVRLLAAELLRTGENAGDHGAEAVLAGLTLAAKRTALDGLLATQDGATHRYIADTIDNREHSIAPRAVDLILRDALAPLNADADPRCGWWSQPDAEPIPPDALDDRLGMLRALLDNTELTDEAEATLQAFLDLAQASRDEPAYRRDAAAWADTILGAGAVLDDPPAWLDQPAREQLRRDLSAGLAALVDEPELARDTLGRAARLFRVVAATDSLPADLQSRELRDAVNSLAGAPEGDPRHEAEAVRRIAETYAQSLDLIAAEARAPRAGTLVRQARPMLKPLGESHRRTADAMVKLLPRILAEPDPMTDPAILAATGSLRLATADLTIPADVSAALAGWHEDPTRPIPTQSREPVATRLMGPLAQRVQQLGVALAREDKAADALAQLRELQSTLRIAPALPGEAELRAGAADTEWRRVTGDQAQRLLFVVDQARERWLRSAATEQFADQRPGDEAHLRTLAAVLPLLRDAATLEQMQTGWSRGREPNGNQLPAWELGREGLFALTGDLSKRAARLAAIAARGDSDAAALGAAQDLERDFAAALLCARLEREAQAQPRPACTVAAELGAGCADEHAWRAEDRHTLAAICRTAHEAGAATGQQRDTLTRWANKLAEGVE